MVVDFNVHESNKSREGDGRIHVRCVSCEYHVAYGVTEGFEVLNVGDLYTRHVATSSEGDCCLKPWMDWMDDNKSLWTK